MPPMNYLNQNCETYRLKSEVLRQSAPSNGIVHLLDCKLKDEEGKAYRIVLQHTSSTCYIVTI